jgi:hypothetical protein
LHIQYALFDVGSDGASRTWVRGASAFGNQLVWDSATSMSNELEVRCLISAEVELTPPSLSNEYPNNLGLSPPLLPSYKLWGEWVKTGNLDLNILSPTRPKPLGKTSLT